MCKLPRLLTLIALIFALTACLGGGHPAPVVERQGRPSVIPDSHLVHRGETLYSIAWRYGMDFKGLASANNIGWPYTIYPGQRLKIKAAASSTAKTRGSTSASTARTTTSQSSRVTKPTSANTSKETADGLALDAKRFPFRWQWPVKGRLLKTYHSGSAVHKGIDIQGNLGEPVRAANSGKVVYAGSGLVGYGKLLIIKHDEQYLSAYGHNRVLLVGEGELVKVGQKIAEIGDTGTDRAKLHFEIRRNGQPINPLSKLPRG